eukprot:gnl/TRDRNA2_/TRDRNA2_186571_c0_seq1.p1 gnl/TRDRNA2_/TRDRNA2_186571_c0~~gnl/TRDRNA2_/TRDRNA2_186571_c0_seq1.p1  ORF type:complete len:470 (+),score=74.17 gnl/TRDRNA2_/TRDRNA2_186571_c0_seq1:130-1539(+)
MTDKAEGDEPDRACCGRKGCTPSACCEDGGCCYDDKCGRCCKDCCEHVKSMCSIRKTMHTVRVQMFGHRQKGRETMCMCVPLRTAVFLNASITCFTSILMVTCKRFFSGLRVINGGYCLTSSVIIGFIEYTGIAWGVIGVIGAVRLKTSYIRIYNYYQMARVTSWIGMYYTDTPLLWNCELWRTDIKAAVKAQGWNPVMYDIAMGNQCEQQRSLFMFCSTFGLFFFIYLIMVNQRLQEELETEPRYLIRQAKDLADGAFYTQSLGQRAKPSADGATDEERPIGPDGFERATDAETALLKETKQLESIGYGGVGPPVLAPVQRPQGYPEPILKSIPRPPQQRPQQQQPQGNWMTRTWNSMRGIGPRPQQGPYPGTQYGQTGGWPSQQGGGWSSQQDGGWSSQQGGGWSSQQAGGWGQQGQQSWGQTQQGQGGAWATQPGQQQGPQKRQPKEWKDLYPGYGSAVPKDDAQE